MRGAVVWSPCQLDHVAAPDAGCIDHYAAKCLGKLLSENGNCVVSTPELEAVVPPIEFSAFGLRIEKLRTAFSDDQVVNRQLARLCVGY